MKKILTAVLCSVFMVSIYTIAQAAEGTVRVTSVSGDVEITPSGKTQAVKGEPEMVLKSGDRIRTGKEAYLEMAFDKKGANIVKVASNSDVVMELDGDNKIELVDGELYVLLDNLKKGESFKVSTPGAICGARGTGWQMTTDGVTTDVAVFDNKVFIRGINKEGSPMEETLWISEGFEAKIKRFERPMKPVRIPKEQLSKMRTMIRRPRKLLSRTTDSRWVLFRKQPLTTIQTERTEKIVNTIDKRDAVRNKMQSNIQERTEDSKIQKERRILKRIIIRRDT